MPKGTSQNQFVLNHLIDHGYITEVVARNYGIRRLASRIHDLVKQSLAIQKETRIDDAGVKYTYYTLDAETQTLERQNRERGGTWNKYVDEVTARAA